jgi:Phosphotransferase enzyme family
LTVHRVKMRVVRVSDRIEQELEDHLGALTRLGGGFHSRVYLSESRDSVVKVYRKSTGMHKLEAAHMARAGLGAFVLGTFELEGWDVLVMQRFHGAPLQAKDVATALPNLGKFLRELHGHMANPINQDAIKARLERFHGTLDAVPERPQLEPLFKVVHAALENSVFDGIAGWCHLDLWQANVLFAAPDNVLIVDWAKSTWDDPARDYALLMTGTFDTLKPKMAVKYALELATAESESVAARLPVQVALTTLHDLHWFLERDQAAYHNNFEEKLNRALLMLECL